jgi:hypothetical protein
MNRQSALPDDEPERALRRLIARRLYRRAACLLLAAERAVAGLAARDHLVARVLRATAARLQVLAARLESPAPAPVPVPGSRPHTRRSA